MTSLFIFYIIWSLYINPFHKKDLAKHLPITDYADMIQLLITLNILWKDIFRTELMNIILTIILLHWMPQICEYFQFKPNIMPNN